VLGALGGIGLVLVLLGPSSGARGTLLPLGLLIVILAMLSQPNAGRTATQVIPDMALIVTDDSASGARIVAYAENPSVLPQEKRANSTGTLRLRL